MKTLFAILGVASAIAFATPTFAAPASVSFKSPGPGMHFTAGIPVRILADGIDPDGYQWNFGRMEADLVIFFVDGSEIARVEPTNGLIDWFEAYTAGLSAGTHVLTLESHNFGGVVARSQPISIIVDPMPSKTVVTLTQDLVLTGSNDLSWNNVIVQGNGFKVRAATNWTGDVQINNSFVTGLGAENVAGIDVATGSGGQVVIDRTVFEDTGAVNVKIDGSGQLQITDNEFRANNRIAFDPSNPDLSPVFFATGNTSGAKRFSGNRVGAGLVYFEGMSNLLIGGDSDAAGNVLIGPRTVLRIDHSPQATVRGNYSHHNYRGGWSQGFNFNFSSSSSNPLIEHNVIRSGSWPVQDVAGTFRYNLLVDVGHSWIRTAVTGTRIHHNVFVHNIGSADTSAIDAGMWFYTGQSSIEVYNNTFDAGGVSSDINAPVLAVSAGTSVSTFHNNVVTGFTTPSSRALVAHYAAGETGTVVNFADYNSFYNPNSSAPNYESGVVGSGNGAHDVTGNPKFAVGTEIPYAIDESQIWNRSMGVSSVLAHYRTLYAPAAGSPLIDTGGPAGTTGVDIGAIESSSGTARPEDLFGKFPVAGGASPKPPTSLTVN